MKLTKLIFPWVLFLSFLLNLHLHKVKNMCLLNLQQIQKCDFNRFKCVCWVGLCCFRLGLHAVPIIQACLWLGAVLGLCLCVTGSYIMVCDYRARKQWWNSGTTWTIPRGRIPTNFQTLTVTWHLSPRHPNLKQERSPGRTGLSLGGGRGCVPSRLQMA